MKLYSYKIVRDFGFAPNPFHGLCTLATCKPKIRKNAVAGDLIVGCGSAANGLVGRVICLMRVTGKCTFQDYWDDPQFAAKHPFFKGSRSRAYGDNIYHHDVNGHWMQDRSHHSFKDGGLNHSNLSRDTSSDHVLWSNDFVYFGREAPLIPENLRAFAGDDLYPKGRSDRVRFPDGMAEAVDDWFVGLPERGCRGRPAGWL